MCTRFVLSQHFETVAQQQLATRTQALKAALAEGMQSGQPRHADEVFDEIEAQVLELAKSKG